MRGWTFCHNNQRIIWCVPQNVGHSLLNNEAFHKYKRYIWFSYKMQVSQNGPVFQLQYSEETPTKTALNSSSLKVILIKCSLLHNFPFYSFSTSNREFSHLHDRAFCKFQGHTVRLLSTDTEYWNPVTAGNIALVDLYCMIWPVKTYICLTLKIVLNL